MSKEAQDMAPAWNDEEVCRSYLEHHTARNNPDQLKSGELIRARASECTEPGLIVCDIGCGGGEFSIDLVSTGIRLKKFFNTEPSPHLRKVAEHRVSAAGLNENIRFLDSPSELEAGSVHVIALHRVVNNVLESGLRDIFEQADKALTQDGLLFASLFGQEALTPEQRLERINIFEADGTPANEKELKNGMIVTPKCTATVTDGIVNYFYQCDYVHSIAAEYGLRPVEFETLESTDKHGKRRTPLHCVIYGYE